MAYQFGLVGSMGMDLSLSLCYLLMIEAKWQQARLCKLEPFLHGLIWPIAIVPAVYGVTQQAYILRA